MEPAHDDQSRDATSDDAQRGDAQRGDAQRDDAQREQTEHGDGASAAAPERDEVHDAHHLDVAVSHSRAFDAYVRDLDVWWHRGRTRGTGLRVDAVEGGAIVEHHADGTEEPWGEVLEVEQGTRIRHSYRLSATETAIVTVLFTAGEHGGTTVEVSHEAWDASEDDGKARLEEWRQALQRFGDHATHI